MNTSLSSTSTIPSTSAALPGLKPEPRRRRVDVDVLARRMGRIAFGVGFLVGPLVIALLDIVDVVAAAHVAPFLLTGWFGAFLARILVTAMATSWLVDGTGRTGDTLLRASLIVPAVLLALVGPISLHAPIALLLDGNRALDGWAAMSLIVVFAQLVLVVMLVRRVLRLVDGEAVKPVMHLYWCVVAASCVPGVLAFVSGCLP